MVHGHSLFCLEDPLDVLFGRLLYEASGGQIGTRFSKRNAIDFDGGRIR